MESIVQQIEDVNESAFTEEEGESPILPVGTGALVRARVVVRGTRPMLWNWFGPDAIPLEKQERTGVAGNDPEEWKRTVLVTPEKQLYILPSYVFSCMKAGGRYTSVKRSTMERYVACTLQVVDTRILIDRFLPDPLPQNDFEAPVYLDIRSVVNPGSKARNIRYRVAASPGWQTEFTIEWDRTIVSGNQMKAIARDAGKFEGLGNGRKIGCGRFEVISFDILE